MEAVQLSDSHNACGVIFLSPCRWIEGGCVYRHFNLTLVMTQACNLRCTYCYTGPKRAVSMPKRIGWAAIDRAVASIDRGGVLDLAFFGGEPLLQAERTLDFMEYARAATDEAGLCLNLSLTTNGTITNALAWSMLASPEVDVAISHDGLPKIHDLYRRTISGEATSERVESTIRRLAEIEKPFRVVMVVRPDTVNSLTDGIVFLQGLGVRSIEPSLDLWERWTGEDLQRLEREIARCAQLWRSGLPERSIGWFDEKASRLLDVLETTAVRCGFGDGELAVACSGRVYPCERLVGEDREDSPMAMRTHVMDGKDFLNLERKPARSDTSCGLCAMQSDCSTICRCSNYIRTGDITRPDGLLCTWNQACLTETATALARSMPGPAPNVSTLKGDLR